MTTAELHISEATARRFGWRQRIGLATAAWIVAALLPLVGLVSLLMREQLDLDWSNHRVHFIVFLFGAGCTSGRSPREVLKPRLPSAMSGHNTDGPA